MKLRHKPTSHNGAATKIRYSNASSGFALTMAGLAAGLLLAAGSTHVLERLLYGVTTTDVRTFGLVVALVIGATLAACGLPAIRATRVDPMRVQRQG
jgi:putative ABC transport system permease protein